MKSNIKTESNVSTARIAFWYVVSNFLTVAIGNLTTPIFARLMSTDDYGRFSNFLTWQNLLLIFFSLSLVTSIGKAKYDYAEKIQEYLSTMVLLGNLVGIIFWIIIELNAGWFTGIFNMEIGYIRIMLLDIMLMPAFTLLQAFFRLYNKYKFFVFFSVFSAVIRTGASIVLILLMEDKFVARVIGYVVPSIIMNLGLWIYIIYRGRGFRAEYCIYALPISLPMVVNSFAGNILTTSDRIMINEYCGETQTALYTMAYSCSTIANVLWTALNQAWTPWLFDRLHGKEYKAVRSRTKGLILVYFSLMAGMMLVLPEILWFFGGEKYLSVITIVPIIFISIFCQFIYGLYVNVETYMKKTYYSMIGTGMAAGINVVLNIFAIQKWGYMAAAYTTFIGYLMLAVFHTIIINTNKEYKNLYDARFNYLLMLLLVGYSFVCHFLYDYRMIRYICVLIYGSLFLVLLAKYKTGKTDASGLKEKSRET